MTTENPNQNQKEGDKNEKLYAGKFKTVDELENGYKNAATVFDENTNLKKMVDELTNIPHDYINPSDVKLDENHISDLKARAKEAGLTQGQYEKMIRSDITRVDKYKQNFENSKKEIGEETLNILKDYVLKNYPKEIHENVINAFIANKEARQSALAHRDKLLNNQVPGMNQVGASSGGYNVSDADIKKAYADKEKNPHDQKVRAHYLNLVAMRAEQKSAT